MKEIQVQFKKCHRFAKMPTKHALESGYDLYVVADDAFGVLAETEMAAARCSISLAPGESHLFDLGIKAAIQEGFGCLLFDRSGMGAKRLIHRFAGVIDGTYRGEWRVLLFNHSNQYQVIHEGDRIVQGILHEVTNGTWEEVDELPESIRGEAGFGASGA